MKRIFDLRRLVLAGAVVWMAAAATPARAQDPDDMKRGVARISLINGDVSVRRGDSGEWVAGVVNAPLLTDDRIATGANSRSEVEFDASNVLRIGGNAEVRLAQLESGIYHLEIAKGTVTYRILHASTANAELDTPSVSVRPAHEGSYRITVNDAGETEITARAGDVELMRRWGMRLGLSTWKPARILPLSPTNIMASAWTSWRSSSSSGGVGGRRPPSYQMRSTAPRGPRAGYWKRTTLAEGKEKSFFTPEAMPSVSTCSWLAMGSMLVGPERSSARNTVHRL